MGNYVLDPISSFAEKHAPITALAAYDNSTSWVIDLRGQNDKVVIVKNIGGSALTFNILGSIDGGTSEDGAIEYDETHLGDTVVAPAAQSVQRFADYYTYIKVQVKGVGGIAVIKAASTGN